MKNPHIKTELPGPRARAMIARDAAVVSPSYPRDYPFVMSHGKGAEVWDVDGNRFLDFAAGIAVCATGHSHPKVVEAITEAAKGVPCASRRSIISGEGNPMCERTTISVGRLVSAIASRVAASRTARSLDRSPTLMTCQP